MTGNPFLDPAREIQQGKSEEDILAGYRMRQHATAGAVAEGNPGYRPLEGPVRQKETPAKETFILYIDATVREHLRKSAQHIFDDMEAFCREAR